MIGVFGGTFDPVHNGHLQPASDVLQTLNLEHIRFIPNRQPPHREMPWLSVEDRLSLLLLAMQSYPKFILDERELKRAGPSYMVDTIQSLKDEFSSEVVVLILGMDALAGFEQWHRWQDIMHLCHLVITQRPGFDVSNIGLSDSILARLTQNKADLTLQASGLILLQSVSQHDVSSTEIRQRLKVGENVNEFMPKMVYEQLMRFVGND